MAQKPEVKPVSMYNPPPPTLVQTPIDCSQAEKRLWLVKVNYKNTKKEKIFI
jgi:hypothetical protein